MRTDLLLILADFLETVPDEKFDLRVWRTFEKTAPGFFACGHQVTDEELTEPDCGTAACAVGWAITIPKIKKTGLYLESATPCIDHPEHGKIGGFDAVCYVFELTYDEATSLFLSGSYENLLRPPTGKDVAKAIRQVIYGNT